MDSNFSLSFFVFRLVIAVQFDPTVLNRGPWGSAGVAVVLDDLPCLAIGAAVDVVHDGTEVTVAAVTGADLGDHLAAPHAVLGGIVAFEDVWIREADGRSGA